MSGGGGVTVWIALYLVAAITLEVAATLLLPLTQGFSKPLPTAGVVVGYLAAFYLLSVIVQVLPVAVVYAVWSGLGVFLVAIFGYLFYSQALSWQVVLGLCLIVVGVIIVNTFSSAHGGGAG